MKIRKGKITDAKEILKILNETPEFQGTNEENFYTIDFVNGYLKYKDRNLVLVAEEDKKIIGFLMAEIWKEKIYSYLGDIFVKKEFRKLGTANKLQEEYEKRCKKLGLDYINAFVLVKNKKMQEWCKKHNIKQGNTFYYYEKRLK